MGLVTIARFTDPHAAYLAKAALEAEGIAAFVADDALIQMNWLYSGAIGGAKVQVDESDEEDATRILNEDHRAELPLDVDAACPSCSSTTVGTQRISRFGRALTLLLGFPVEPLRYRLRCSRCGHTWKPTGDSTLEYDDVKRLEDAEQALAQHSTEEPGHADFLRAAWPTIVLIIIVIGLVGVYFTSRRYPGF